MKKHKRQPFNPALGMLKFQARLAQANITPANEQDQEVVLMPALIQVDRLMQGTLTQEGYIELTEANVTAFCLAAILHKHGANEATKKILEPAQPVFEAAADALADIGVRRQTRGKYLATGPELKLVRDSMDWLRALMEVADRGHIARACTEAGEMVESKLKGRKVA